MHKGIIILLCIFFIFKVLFLFFPHYPSWDESVYLSMGKYIYSGGTIGLWEPIRPLIFPLVLGFYWLITSNIELTMLFGEFTVLLSAVGIVWLIYLIGKESFNEKAALFGAIIFAITPLFIYWSSHLLTGIPSVFLSLLAFYFFIKKNPFFCGLFAALGFMTRFPLGLWLIIFPLLLLIEKRKPNSFMLFFIGFILPSSLYLITNHFLYGDFLYPFLIASKHASSLLYQQAWWYYFDKISWDNIFYILVPLSFAFIRKKHLCLIIPVIVFLIFFTIIPNKQFRFVLIVLPFCAILAGYVVHLFLSKKNYLTYLLLGLFTLFPIAQAGVLLHQRINSQPNGPYAELPQVKGTVLTLDPIPAVYINALFIPFYNSVDDAVRIYEQEKTNYVFVFEEFYPCFNEECEGKKTRLFERIRKEHQEIFSKGKHRLFKTFYGS